MRLDGRYKKVLPAERRWEPLPPAGLSVEMRRATAPRGLLLADKNLDGRPVEIPVLAQLILQESAVRLLNPLRQVAEEGERGYTARR